MFEFFAAQLIVAFYTLKKDGEKTEPMKLNLQVTQSHWLLQGMIYQTVDGLSGCSCTLFGYCVTVHHCDGRNSLVFLLI